jgi:hypothetical protein
MKLSKNDLSFLLQIQHLDDDEIIELILEYCKKRYENDTTRATKINAFKMAVKGGDILFDKSKLSDIIDQDLTLKLKDKLNQDGLPDKRPIAQHIIDKLYSFKGSEHRDELFLYLMLTCGRRAAEFLEGAWTKCVDDHLWIDKLSKKVSTPPETGYKIKLHHAEPHEFIDLHTKMVKKMHNKAGVRMKTKSMLDSAGRLLRKITDGHLKLSHLRPLYVLLSTQMDSLRNPNTLIKELLHHENHASSSHYNQRFYIEPHKNIEETLTINKNKL